MDFDPGSRTKLTARDVGRFPSESLFDRVGRVVAEAECLPRKELYEAWEVARRVRRRFRGGRVVDLACGHGLVAWLLLLLDDSSPTAVAVDRRVPASAEPLGAALTAAWPRLTGRIDVRAGDLEEVALEAGDLVVATHACGALSDLVIARAMAAKARLALVPCCQDAETCDSGGLLGWLDVATAVDVTRVARLRSAGYDVQTQQLPAAITAKNRLLVARPPRPPRPTTGDSAAADRARD